jgi:Uri superfamily endonuclease
VSADRSAESVLDLPGTYALVFACPEPITLVVGALGPIRLDSGHLLYLGSAFGPGGLAGRLRHHLRPIVRPRWHVDYLHEGASLLGAWCAAGPRELEHVWARALADRRGFRVAHPHFGSSDCDCETHLLHVRRPPTGRSLAAGLSRAGRGVGARYRARAELEARLRQAGGAGSGRGRGAG